MDFFKEEYENFELAFITAKYLFYKHKEECDENVCTVVFDRNMNLISSNYFATELFMETLKEIKEGKESVCYMSPDTIIGFMALKENGYFEE